MNEKSSSPSRFFRKRRVPPGTVVQSSPFVAKLFAKVWLRILGRILVEFRMRSATLRQCPYRQFTCDTFLTHVKQIQEFGQIEEDQWSREVLVRRVQRLRCARGQGSRALLQLRCRPAVDIPEDLLDSVWEVNRRFGAAAGWGKSGPGSSVVLESSSWCASARRGRGRPRRKNHRHLCLTRWDGCAPASDLPVLVWGKSPYAVVESRKPKSRL
ncbi:hypothetical protein GEV33_009965 [Tenebrio molitor]|uniref:Uncharacterized protein n=1 Tax=Tenebrio molitor TaxID=7067 RepID=A0A8J6LGX9_TENMO|nr:hypothetical protein GEV33_009965 [Tenebrio molitor]